MPERTDEEMLKRVEAAARREPYIPTLERRHDRIHSLFVAIR